MLCGRDRKIVAYCLLFISLLTNPRYSNSFMSYPYITQDFDAADEKYGGIIWNKETMRYNQTFKYEASWETFILPPDLQNPTFNHYLALINNEIFLNKVQAAVGFVCIDVTFPNDDPLYACFTVTFISPTKCIACAHILETGLQRR
jgi:hypothetical protein